MVELFLLVLLLGYLFYIITYKIPKQLERNEEKIDKLKSNIQEAIIRLNKLEETINRKINKDE